MKGSQVREQSLNRASARRLFKCILVTSLAWIGLSHVQATRTFARNPDEHTQQQRQPGNGTSEFVVGFSLPAEFREKADLAAKAEHESRWTDARDLRHQIKAACEKRFGTDDWRPGGTDN
jgi:hypothetical protein